LGGATALAMLLRIPLTVSSRYLAAAVSFKNGSGASGNPDLVTVPDLPSSVVQMCSQVCGQNGVSSSVETVEQGQGGCASARRVTGWL